MEWKLKTFDELSKEELYEILKLRVDVFVVEQNCPYEEIDSKDLDCYHLFCTDKGEIIAYLRILKKGVSFDNISIGRVVIKNNYRKLGLGRVMLTKALLYIKNELKEETIKISAQHYLIEFYESLGFNPISDVYLEDGIPHINMILSFKK